MKKVLGMRMAAKVKFNREIRDTDYVSPGSYEVVFQGADGVKGFQFDFHESEGYRDLKNAAILQFICKDLDEQTFEDLKDAASEDLGSIKEIREFYVYTGEPEDAGSDLAPVELLSFELEIREEGNAIRDLEAPAEAFRAINQAWDEEQRRREEINGLFWMNRNLRGLDEVGYLMTAQQLKEEAPEAYDAMMAGDEDYEGAYWGNDTFHVERIHSEKDIRSFMTWEGFDPQESHASGSLDYDYPAFVDKRYRLGRRVYAISGYTSVELPRSGAENPTVGKWMKRLGLSADDIAYKASTEDYVAMDLSNVLADGGTIELEEYKEVLSRYGVECPKFVEYSVEFTTTVTVVAAEGDKEAAEEEAAARVFKDGKADRNAFYPYVREGV